MKQNTNFVILSSIDLGSKMKVGRTTRLRSAPGRSWEMMWERTGHGCQFGLHLMCMMDGEHVRTIALVRLDHYECQ